MIPFIDLQSQHRRIQDSIQARMGKVFAHGQFIMGQEIVELETRLSAYTGAKHTISCSSGSDALVMALMALDVGPGDAVFVPSMTFIATSEAVERVGAQIRFVDIDPRTFNMDPSDLEKQIAITQKSSSFKPAAVIPVNLFGVCADYEKLHKIADRHGLHLIEDAAQSFGAAYKKKRSGNLARISCTSFFPAKPLGCYGDGGAVFTSDDEIASRLKSIRVHGQGKERYHHIQLGLTARLDTLQAAVLLSKMDIFDSEIESREKSAALYTRFLGENAPSVITPLVPQDTSSAWAQYSILFSDVKQRDAVRSELESKKIPTVVYYPIPLHIQPVYSKLGYKPQDFPASVQMSQTILSLPMHPYLTHETIEMISKLIGEALKK